MLLDLTRSNESYTSIIFGTPDGQFSDEVLQIEALSKTLTWRWQVKFKVVSSLSPQGHDYT